MATLVFATLLAGGGLFANNKRLKAKAASAKVSEELIELTQPTTLQGNVNTKMAVSSILKRQIPNQRGLTQNIYSTNDYDVSSADLQNRAEKVYGEAVAKDASGKVWGKPTLDGLDDGDGRWTLYARNPSDPKSGSRSINSFEMIPFKEEPWTKNASAARGTTTNVNSKRKFEQMTSVGTGGYQPKREVLNEINAGENPVSTNLIDNVGRLNAQNMVATTFDGTNLPGNIEDSSTTIKNYIATRQNTIDNKSVDPAQKTFAITHAGNGDRSYSAPALLPQNYRVNHRRNVAGTHYDQLRFNHQTINHLPQAYNKVENMSTLPVDKGMGQKVSTMQGRVGNVHIAYGSQGPSMEMVSGSGLGTLPTTVLTTSQHSNHLAYDPLRFAQTNVDRPIGESERGGIILNRTLKEDSLFEHRGNASNNIFSNASYLSRIEPMPMTNKETLIHQRFGRAISLGLPEQSNYQTEMQDWRRDLQNTNSSDYEGQLHRTPGAFVPGDQTRYMPNAPNFTNKEAHIEAIGAMGSIGGFSSALPNPGMMRDRVSERKMGREYFAAPMVTNNMIDTGNTQLSFQEQNIGQNLRTGKKYEIVTPSHQFGGNFQITTNNTHADPSDFRSRWQQTAKKPKIYL